MMHGDTMLTVPAQERWLERNPECWESPAPTAGAAAANGKADGAVKERRLHKRFLPFGDGMRVCVVFLRVIKCR